MESKDLEAEIHPLKHGEGKAPESPANCAKKASVPKKPGRLSRLRTAAFFLSLFLCLTVVFAFSFVIPCPVRPISEKTWSRTYDQAGESMQTSKAEWVGNNLSLLEHACSIPPN